jgi:hypothetical protein
MMQIQKGRYYWNYWLRRVDDISGDRVQVADFTGLNILSRTHLMRWATAEYTEDEAKEMFPKEFAEIREAVVQAARGQQHKQSNITRTPYINEDELKVLWRMLERLQADVERSGTYNWRESEIEALVTVMYAVKDTYTLPPLSDSVKACSDTLKV